MSDQNIASEEGTTNYIDAKEFTSEMAVWANECRDAMSKGNPKPQVTESIGKYFLLIAENMSMWYRFRGYTFREEMVGDAIENMIRYAHNFDETKSGKSGAFSYFSRITYFAFLRRIEKEDTQFRTKVKWVQSHTISDLITGNLQDHDQGADFENQFGDYLKEYYDAQHKKIGKKKKNKKKEEPREKTSLEQAMESQAK